MITPTWFSQVIRVVARNPAFVTFALLLGGGLALTFYPPEWYLERTVHALADALMVAGLLGGTVDWLLKRALLRDVFGTLVGWTLPDEIRSYISEVSRTSLVKRNYQAKYEVRKDHSKVIFDVTEEWDVFNYSSRATPYATRVAINTNEYPDANRDQIKCEFRYNGQTRVHPAADLNAKFCSVEATRVVYALPEVWLDSQDIEDRRTEALCHVRWHYRLTKNLEDVILTYSPLPIVGVSVHLPPDAPIQFDIDSGHGSVDHTEGSSEWKLPRLYMPLQCFSIRWRKRTDGSTEP